MKIRWMRNPPYTSTLIYSTLLYSTLLYSTLLYSTLLYSPLLYSTPLYSAPLVSNHFYSPLHFSFPSIRLCYLFYFFSWPLSNTILLVLSPLIILIFIVFVSLLQEIELRELLVSTDLSKSQIEAHRVAEKVILTFKSLLGRQSFWFRCNFFLSLLPFCS